MYSVFSRSRIESLSSVLKSRPDNAVILALRKPLESPNGDDEAELTREEIEAKARGGIISSTKLFVLTSGSL
ncbi:hypothetical protein Pmar_PMAR011877 [Perkinsus marinus ATCC 50983]|uniref:Uncharacterized protein n=1 Tax=Perkinsus marinus (strain ATCC 50983 / TXsc) TaxID=423536 RepID=C5LBK5_PERM5|nr:hypothetical protein Pmar_PMAR011877 [Perkinsus marinus ATCC 50983]EER05826.1 hypothetical protein Pmar_PMAR011877 [Perkinsus marinus ATCC 50983]|eukprot:XP_002774010.1 hypothetical protein Pmar_PMAR011877 [Perkinsus marinus ATCC 50983]